MNAEALIGTVLGTCMLQKLIGQGGMGAVFLAQQSRPRRQVAVKVLLPVSSQSPNQQAAFLERFRRETDAAASLEHPNIVPVHEYGERDGLAYLVMPYISGGTLRDEMESEEPFPLSKAMSYLDQMAAALSFAHEHGVIHRDIKPANILMTPERRLLLTDFGLVKVISDSNGQTPNSRLTAVGVPMGTPDYMAPEQVIGIEVDSRADLYSLGVILFQMLTGKTPFRGDMPMQIAMQHLHTPAPSPRQYRPDLSITTEQVVMRSLAKRPTDRYANANELANAFRLALLAAGVPLGDTQMGMPSVAQDARSFTRRSLFDPMWQGNGPAQASPSVPRSRLLRPMPLSSDNPTPSSPAEQNHRNDIVAKTSMTMPSFSGFFEPPTHAAPQANAPLTDVQPAHMTPLPESMFPQNALPPSHEPAPASAPQNSPASSHALRFGRRSLLRAIDTAQPSSSAPASAQNPAAESAESVVPPAMLAAMDFQAAASMVQVPSPQAEAPQPFHPKTLAGLPHSSSEPSWQTALSDAPPAFSNPFSAESQAAQPSPQNFSEAPQSASTTRVLGNTNALVPSPYENQGMTGMIKLTQPMKVVKVPIAGKPGTYMTGLLSMSPEIQEAISASQQQPSDSLSFVQKNLKKLALIAVVLLVLVSTISIAAITHKSPAAPHVNNSSLVNVSAAATANAAATVQAANIILEDSLSTNIHSWKESSSGNLSYVFKDGKYHVSVNNGAGAALADLPEEIMPDAFVFSVDASEIKGDDTSVNNQFGLVFRLNQSQKDGQPWVTFYSFQVQNTQGDIEYQLRKYDSSYADDAEKWSTPWHVTAGKEFHFGHGAAGNNSFKLMVKGSNFTFMINGKTVGAFKDTSFKAGRIGFLVNQKGTEVAFSNLLLTNN